MKLKICKEIWRGAEGMQLIVQEPLETDLKNILDSFQSLAIYVTAADDHRLLYFNKKVLEVTPHVQLGMVCHEVWEGFCNNCPIGYLGEKDSVRTLNYNCPVAAVADVSATRIMWQGKIPAYIISVAPHMEDEQTRVQSENAMREQMVCLYTVDESYEVVSYTKNTEEIFPQLSLGEKCYQSLFGKTEPCENCPRKQLVGEDETRLKSDNYEYLTRAIPCKFADGREGYTITLYEKLNQEGKKESKHALDAKSVGEEKYRDSVTNGYNRNGFIDTVRKLRENHTDLSNYSVIFVNIKGFKAMNDVMGHDAGDNLLRVLFMSYHTSGLRPKVASRMQSDHFVFLVKKENLDLEVLSELLTYKWKYHNQEVLVHCQCGIYHIDDGEIEIYEMIDRAKIAMERNNNSGVTPYTIFDKTMRNDYFARAEVLLSYEEAIRNNEFQVYYQPIVDARTGKIASAEALVRWVSPKKGVISPGTFLPVLEENGYITKLDIHILNSVDRFLHNRVDRKLPIVPISINLSRMDLFDITLTEVILDKIKNNTLPPDMIRYEITEMSIASIEDSGVNFLNQLRENGRKLLVDDFGSGYSSFNMLNKVDFDILKIDMDIIRQIEYNAKARGIISILIGFCNEIGIQIVAEGVETEVELEFLRSKGCDYIQGYYFSKPLCEADFVKYLEEHLE